MLLSRTVLHRFQSLDEDRVRGVCTYCSRATGLVGKFSFFFFPDFTHIYLTGLESHEIDFNGENK